MLKLTLYSFVACLLSLILGFSFAQAQVVANEVVPGEFIVKMKESRLAKGQQGKIQGLEKMNSKLQGKAQFKKSMSSVLHHFQALNKTETQSVINELKNDPDVEYVEPNFYVRRAQAEAETDNHIYSLDDVHEMNTSGSYVQSMANVGITQTWPVLSIVDQRPVVAIIDTGVDITHPIFVSSSSIWVNTLEVPNNGIDDDGNGFVDDINGWNFNARTANIMDDEGHGTHVAGIVQGVGQDIFAATLEQAKIKIMPLKFMNASGSGTTADAISAVYYAVNNGARVINNSWGGSNYSQALHDSLAYAYSRGVVVVNAAGNYARNNDTSPMYPANLPVPSAVSVAATNDYDTLASFSSYGPNTVDVAAPGVLIFSTYPNNSFRYLSGTSMAAPMVAGLAALIVREAPNLSGYQIKEKIMNSSDYVVNLKTKTKASSRMDSYSTVVSAKADVGVQSFQPSYAANPPAGAVDYSLTSQQQGTGCGTVAAVSSQMTGALRSLSFTEREIFVFLMLLMLPMVFLYVTKMKWVAQSRRAHDRFVLNSEVKIKVGGRELVGNLNTIGVGGVSFDADAMIARGGQVNLTITGPDGKEQIQVLGRVVWSEQSKSYGVQFAPTKESIVDRIRSWSSNLVKAA